MVLHLRLTAAQHGQTPVLGGLALTVSRGESVAVTGPSGIGKTTLLRIVAGLHKDWQGDLDLPGRLAMVFQDPTLLPWRSALENIIIPTRCSSDRARNLLVEVGLGGLDDRFPDALSVGQQRRLSLARALACDPDVLLMDEPFASLDDRTADEMMALFEQAVGARNVAVLLVTHSETEAMRLSDRIIRLDGTPATIADTRPGHRAHA